MLYGYKHKNSYGAYVLRVSNFPSMTYIGYSEKAAIKKYRERYGLKYKKICW